VQRYQGESTQGGGQGFGAASIGGGGMGGGIQRPPEFFTYRDTIEALIKSGFAWHDSRIVIEARVCFSVSSTGSVSSLNLCQPSGNRHFDEAAMRAVARANPLPAPPESVASFFESVRIHFSSVE
jgi:TonB family protein